MKPVVLVVDDDREIRDFLTLAMKPLYEVHVAPDGRAGQARAHELRPHVMVVDLGMPGMNGLELTEYVKGHPELAHTLVLILTGATVGEELPPSFWKMGTSADAFLHKPIDAGTLCAAVDGLLKQRANYRPLPPGRGTYDDESAAERVT
jgi:DNA-binding response OmpR family regulator